MPRQQSIAEQSYPPGEYGPFALDNFNSNNADALELLMTVVGWPAASPLLTVELRWPDNSGMTDTIDGPQPLAEVKWRVGIPKTASEKKAFTGATVKFTTFAPITTAVTVRVV